MKINILFIISILFFGMIVVYGLSTSNFGIVNIDGLLTITNDTNITGNLNIGGSIAGATWINSTNSAFTNAYITNLYGLSDINLESNLDGTGYTITGGILTDGTIQITNGDIVLADDINATEFYQDGNLVVDNTDFQKDIVAGTALSGGANNVLYGSDSDVIISVTNDAIGDTQLEYNTGQHLTTTSNPTFNNLTIINCINFDSGGSICSS